jgi:hypothetical protein
MFEFILGLLGSLDQPIADSEEDEPWPEGFAGSNPETRKPFENAARGFRKRIRSGAVNGEGARRCARFSLSVFRPAETGLRTSPYAG